MDNGRILTSNNAFLPADTTFIVVSMLEYPIPGLTILTDDILLLVITGLS